VSREGTCGEGIEETDRKGVTPIGRFRCADSCV